MSWTRAYRLALHLLPPWLRRKHGPAMAALFARELERAGARGPVQGALAGALGLWDVVQRGIHEWVRPACDTAQPADVDPGHPQMPQPTTRQLLCRHATSFAIAFLALTVSLLAIFATRRMPALLAARGTPVGTMAQVLLLAVPFMAALTIPMAVLVAVLRELTRLGVDGTLAAARRAPGGIRRLVVPLLAASVGVAAIELVVVAEIVPRTNERLVAVIGGVSSGSNGRTMTLGQLQAAARSARAGAESVDLARAARYEVEIQKKLALPAACVVMALVGAAVALRVRRGGVWLVVGASAAVFIAYYVILVRGESLANSLVVSPVVGMWGANVLLLAAALLALWQRRASFGAEGSGTVASRG